MATDSGRKAWTSVLIWWMSLSLPESIYTLEATAVNTATKLEATLPMVVTICGMAATATLYSSRIMASESSRMRSTLCTWRP